MYGKLRTISLNVLQKTNVTWIDDFQKKMKC